MESAPELDLEEAIFLRSKSYSNNIKQNSWHCQRKGAQNHKKHNLRDYKNFKEENEIKNRVNYSIKSNKHEI